MAHITTKRVHETLNDSMKHGSKGVFDTPEISEILTSGNISHKSTKRSRFISPTTNNDILSAKQLFDDFMRDSPDFAMLADDVAYGTEFNDQAALEVTDYRHSLYFVFYLMKRYFLIVNFAGAHVSDFGQTRIL